MEPTTNKEHLKDFQQKGEEAKKFLAEGFLPLLKKVLLQPLELNQEFKQAGTQIPSAVLILLSGILCTLLPYLSIGRTARQFVPFQLFLRVGIAVMLTLIFIGLLSWGIKKLFQKTADFQKELFTGALCSIPLLGALILISIPSLLYSGINFLGGFSHLFTSPLTSIIIIYAFFLMITICFQSLRSVFIKANTAWYLSPAMVMVAIYLSYKIIEWV